jgi:hypothetical protein
VVEDSVKDKVKNNIVLRDYDKLVFFNSFKGKKQLVHGGKLYYFPMLNAT